MSASLTYSDLEARWGVSRRQLRRWVQEGRLKAVRLSYRTVRFQLRDVEAFERDSREAPAAPPTLPVPVPRVGTLSSNPVEDAILRRRWERQRQQARKGRHAPQHPATL